MKKYIFLIPLLFLISACAVQNTPDELENAKKRIEDQQSEINDLRLEIENLKKESASPSQKFKIDLTQWKEDEIIRALTTKNTKFKEAEWFKYEYREDGAYYDIIGAIFPKDPFYEIVYSKKNRQLTVNNLRLFNLDPGNKETGDEEYQKYEDNIKKKLIILQEIKCTFKQECRGTTLITCASSGKELYSWFSYPYLFVTRDDHGETFQTFKEFYCS